MKPIYTAVNATAARSAFDELTEKWGQRYPAVIKLWDNAWNEFIPFLDYDVEIRTVICSTNDRVPQCGAGRAEVPISSDPISGPDRRRQGTMDDAAETRVECVCNHLRRPIPGSRNLLMKTAGNTVNEIVDNCSESTR